MDQREIDAALSLLENRTVGKMKMAHVLQLSDGSYVLLDFGLALPAGADLQSTLRTCCAEIGRRGSPTASPADLWARYSVAPLALATDFPCAGTLKGILTLAVRRES